MNITELEAFHAVYRHRNYTRAATELGISQPALTRRIALLESDLECTLFERGRHGALPTSAGEAFAPYVQRILGELQASIRAVQKVRDGESGRLNLAIAGTIPNTGLMHALRTFRREKPGIQLSIQTATSDEVSALVATGEADVGLRYFATERPELRSKLISIEHGSIVSANPTTLLDLDNLTASALAACPWVGFPTGVRSSGEPIAVRTLETLAFHGIRPENIIHIDGLSAQKRLVTSDFGLAVMQSSAIADELSSGTMQQILQDQIRVEYPIHLVTRVHSYPSLLRESLIDILEAIPSESSSK